MTMVKSLIGLLKMFTLLSVYSFFKNRAMDENCAKPKCLFVQKGYSLDSGQWSGSAVVLLQSDIMYSYIFKTVYISVFAVLGWGKLFCVIQCRSRAVQKRGS